MRIDRMLSIVVILLNRRRIKAQELADRFEVSLRTVYRDIEAINLSGIPIISNQGMDGGYGLPDNYKLNRQFLSPSDMKSILTALKGVNAALDDSKLSVIFEKIQSLLPDDGKKGIDSGDETIVFDPIGWGNSDRSAKKIQTIYEAIKSLKILKLTYLDGNGKRTDRTVEPMTLFQKGFAWYLFGYCHKRNESRIFKLSRIKDILTLDQTFIRKPGDFRNLFEKWQPQEKMIELVLKFSLTVIHVVEEYFESEAVLDQDSDFITVKARLPYGDWLMGMILSYGDKVEVLSPDSFRTDIRNQIRKMASLYNF